MTAYQLGVATDQGDKTGVLLVNLGTPNRPDAGAVRSFLSEFLHDRRVIELSRWVWCPILHGVILRLRPKRSAAAYQTIWQPDGSPLALITHQQVTAVQKHIHQHYSNAVSVQLGMRYGQPSLQSAMRHMAASGINHLLVVPLYPQYSSSTTASVFDAVAKELMTWRNIPELRLIRDYHLNKGYLSALSASVDSHWQTHGRNELILFSFHGTPQRYHEQGDPYFSQCHETASALAKQLGLEKNAWRLSFQSRFGRTPWLKPYTDQTLRALPGQGVSSVDIICPGFAADCLETLEEVKGQLRDVFINAGGQSFRYIPCLNDNQDHIQALSDLVQHHLGGWPTKPHQ